MQVKDSPCGNVLQSTIHTSTYVTAHGKFYQVFPSTIAYPIAGGGIAWEWG